jgi:transposase-like protein
LNWKPKARRYSTVESRLTRVTLAATARAVEDRGAGKTPVFSLLRRGGKVYTKIIPDASSATLFPIMSHKTVPASIVYSDG